MVRLVFGIVIVLIGAPGLIRGLSLMLLSVVNPPAVPEGTAFGFGVFLAGALITATGVLMIVSGARRNKAKRLALRPPNSYPAGQYPSAPYAPNQYPPNQYVAGHDGANPYANPYEANPHAPNPYAPNPGQTGPFQQNPDQAPPGSGQTPAR